MGWSCTACTYHNHNNAAKECFTCCTVRPAPRANASSIDLTGSSGEENEDVVIEATKKRGSVSQRTPLFGGVGGGCNEKASKRVKRVKNEAKNSNAARDSGQSNIQVNFSVAESYTPLSNESYEVRSNRCKEVMKTVFQVDKLRMQQPKAVECALKGQSQIVVMATGAGKSLCYQLPAVVLGGVTVVLSPLIALMRDQVESLTKKGIAAAYINSSNTAEIMDRLLGRKTNVTNTKKSSEVEFRPINIVYVTPESLQNSRFQFILQELKDKQRLAGFAIDEAHCMSSWGHDFRPAYRKLDYIAKSFPNVPLMALTATATPNVIKDIQKTLKLERAVCHVGSFDRPNLFYKVHYKDGLEALQSGKSLTDVAKFIQKQHRKATRDGRPCSGIVYVHKRDDTTFLAKEITKRTGIRAAGYHGGLKDAERTKVQQDWTSGDVQIAIATIAFGMGIDLAHVRYVVHWSIPKTLDGFYQESGRAGRDGLPAISLVYFSRDDANLFLFLINKQEESRKKKSERGGVSGAIRNQEALKKVVDYCMTAHCRRQFVLEHFGEKETDPKSVCQKACDYCTDPERVEKAIRASDACRVISKQRKETAKKRSKAKEWDGQWERPHGDDGFFEGQNEDWEIEGLGITSSAKSKPSFVGSKSFVSAKSLSSKLDTLEAMEMQQNGANGFVQFKTVRREREHFPEHFKEQLRRIPLCTTAAKPRPQERTSSEIAASTDKLRAEIAAIKAKQEALLNRSSKSAAPAAASAPPALLAFNTSTKSKNY